MAPTSTEDGATTSQDGMSFADVFIATPKNSMQTNFNFEAFAFLSFADSQSTRRSKRSVKRNVGATSALDKIRFLIEALSRSANVLDIFTDRLRN